MRSFEEIKTIYDKIFYNINGYAVSLLEKQRRSGEKYVENLIYGEIPLELTYALSILEPTRSYLARGGVFYDLGSGIGNAVIGNYLTNNFNKYVGIEILDSLHNLSNIALNRFSELDKKAKNSILFHRGNMLNYDFSDGDVIFFCCPNKDEAIRQKMAKKMLSLRSDTVIFSFVSVFGDRNNFELLNSRMVRMAWGEAPLLIYRRK